MPLIKKDVFVTKKKFNTRNFLWSQRESENRAGILDPRFDRQSAFRPHAGAEARRFGGDYLPANASFYTIPGIKKRACPIPNNLTGRIIHDNEEIPQAWTGLISKIRLGFT